MAQYNFTKENINIEQLTIEINDNVTISEDVDYIRYKSSGTDNLKIFFTNVLDSAQETELNNVVSAHTSSSKGSKNYLVKEFNSEQLLTKEVWYDTDNGDGTYSYKVEETTYNYDETVTNKLLSYVKKKFLKNGIEISSETFSYYNDTNKEILKRE